MACGEMDAWKKLVEFPDKDGKAGVKGLGLRLQGLSNLEFRVRV